MITHNREKHIIAGRRLGIACAVFALVPKSLAVDVANAHASAPQ
jgi:hypothetical protein